MCSITMEGRVVDSGAMLEVRGMDQSVSARLFPDGIALLAGNGRMLLRIVNEFDKVRKRKRLKVKLVGTEMERARKWSLKGRESIAIRV